MLNRRQFLAATGWAGASLALSGLVTVGGDVHAPDPSLDADTFHGLRRYARTQFGDIAYVEQGSGEAALFLHGFPLNGFQWRGALPRLAPYRRCIAPDFLGMGYTRVAQGQAVGPDDQVAMLLALMDTLGIASTDLVANDSGGAVAQLMLAHHPKRVRTVLLTNCDTEIDSPPAALMLVIELARQGRFVDEWLGRWHADRALARSAEGIGGMCYADAAHPTDEAIDMYFGPLLSTQHRTDLAHAYAIALSRNALAGTAAALRRARAPVWVVWGTADDIFEMRNADHLEHAFGHSRGVRRLSGYKLFWPEERPDVIAEEARALWNAWIPAVTRR
ncbi:alpha/beta fold hydrolase [Stenotrophomonas sp. HITSZ_GD]|uniref:alpha/beta fold hydrolase n=1 Tax=Stenotrophomonas sp. HITSZ_GD TaxID=3037248 RepID=UPI00240DF82E|nr:alpha/beta fold hydrolase [Stenotrophomonas sp. HITSZ_GD]MDG2526097.1 alpha/beta fold hydrolase [Stenotrophomonas sp. HITSZ_GD]